jgi:HAE1 family hydrophobic/amphiphilic exporter-1
MSRLARLSLANRGLVALVAILVVGFGALTIPKLKQQLFPSLDFPAAFVLASYPGASPEIVERQVTIPIEQAVQGVDGLEKVTSTSREGVATIQLEFTFGSDLDNAVSALQSAINRIDVMLPAGVDPEVIAGSTDDFPVVVLAASSSEDESTLADKLRRIVLPEINAVDGVREATVTGDRGHEVVITPDLVAAAQAGVDISALAAALRSNGVSIPAGSLTEGDTSLTVQVGAPLTTVEDLRDLYLSAPGKDPVRLGDVATVESQLAAPTSITRTNGRPSLGIAVTATPDGNAVGISNEIKDKLPALASALGSDAQLTPVFDQAPFVEKSIEGLTTEGALGLVMAVLVILAFLLSIKSTLVTAVSIPLSVVGALIGLWAGDHSLNVLTLGALTIAIGRVVDDSIVVLENIKRHLSYGEDRSQAILTAVKEVAGAVTASTLTTVAVFSPIALVGGLVGELFTPFALTVTVALVSSLLVSLTVVPVLAYWFLKPAGDGRDPSEVREEAEERELRNPLQRAYVPVIEWATRRRVLTVAMAGVVFVATGCLGGLLKTNFFDQSGETTLAITQTMPVGTSMAATDEAARQVEELLAQTDGVATYQTTVGSGGGFFAIGGGGANTASHSVTISDGVDVLAMQESLRATLSQLDDAGQIKVEAGQGGGFSAARIEVIVQADDPQALAAATELVREAVAGTPEVAEVTTDLTNSAPRIEVAVDRAAATAAGLSEAAIGQTVAAAFRGAPLGQYTLDGVQQSLVLRFGLAPGSIDALRALPLGPGVTLGQVAEVSQVDGPVQVSRIDGSRSVTVSGTATGSNIGATTGALTERLAALELPAGASYSLGGVSADQSEAFGDLGLALAAAVAIVFLVMAATFRSLIQPLILLVSIPFAATGAIIGLLVTGTALGVPALIGMLMLIGIVVTNAIVLMDLINQYRSAGMPVREAVIEGGRRRLRPILMTAIATIFALLPMALGLTGSGGFISQPLAIVVIGGLLSSTALTLVLVPTLYTMVEQRRERRVAARAEGSVATQRRHTVSEEPAPVA